MSVEEPQSSAFGVPVMSRSSHDDLGAYPFVTEIEVRWSDLDMLGHVNNVALALLYQEARGRFVEAAALLAPPEERTVRRLLGRTLIQYDAEVFYPEPVKIGVRVSRIGASSYELIMPLFQRGLYAGYCASVFIHHDGRPIPLSAGWRAALAAVKTA